MKKSSKIVILIIICAFISVGVTWAEHLEETFPAHFNLTSLNGTNGFAINGIHPNDSSGTAVSELGDVNGDGVGDFIIGAYTSESYVLFGRKKPWPAQFNLTSLNGVDGFIIDSFNVRRNGISVSSAGDVNGDGINDILIGAQFGKGQSYIIFGRKGPWPIAIKPSDLNGSSGFAMISNSDNGNGLCVSNAGDINGDDIDDILIGAPLARDDEGDQVGKSYVILGNKKPWPSIINLDALDGKNGFVINGVEGVSSSSGWSVSGAGDVNGDGIADILIGTADLNTNIGKSYVVFGKQGQWPAVINLAHLDGMNGFIISSALIKGTTGSSVSDAGDINGDGIDDFLIGTINLEEGIGQSYVVFGRREWPGSIDLANLDGKNGFVIIGVYAEGYGNGSPLSGTGDVNGDGIADILIGVEQFNNFSGQTYVMFGSKKAWPAIIRQAFLDGTTGFVINGIHSKDYSGGAVSGAGDVNGDGVADILIGASGFKNFTGQSYIIFGRKGPN